MDFRQLHFHGNFWTGNSGHSLATQHDGRSAGQEWLNSTIGVGIGIGIDPDPDKKAGCCFALPVLRDFAAISVGWR